MITNVFACLLFSIFHGVWTLLQSIVIEDESSFQVQPTAYNRPPEPFVLYYIFKQLQLLSDCPLLATTGPKAVGFVKGKENYSIFRYLFKACFSHSTCRWFKFFPLFIYASSIKYIIYVAFLITQINRSLDILFCRCNTHFFISNYNCFCA